MSITTKQRVEDIEINLHQVRVLTDRQWILYFRLKPRMFIAHGGISGNTYNLGGSKNDAARYFNMLVRNEQLPKYITGSA